MLYMYRMTGTCETTGMSECSPATIPGIGIVTGIALFYQIRRRKSGATGEEKEMLLWIAALVIGVLLFRNSLRLEGASGVNSEKTVRAYVDGKPVDSYVKE